ncbi:MAG: McrB family protein [Actinomycetes bacterium]
MTESDLSWLASVTDGWFAETSDLSPKVAVPALEQATARRHSIEREIADLRAAGIDADEADLLLMEHDLSGAQRAIRELRELRQLTRQSEALMSKLAELRREASGEQAVPENWMPRVDEAAASLASGEIETAKRQVNVLELDLRRTRRADEIDGLMRLRVDLVALAAPAVVLAEIDAHLADLDADGDTRVNRELQQRLIERLDALRNQRNAETLDLRARIHDLLETGSDVLLDTDRHDFELQLAEIENLIAVEDIMGARRLATDVLAAIQDKRVLQWRREDGESSLVHHVVSFCTQELDFAEDDVRRLYIAAKTKPFVILAGLTGSGKSTIARLFAAALGADARNGRFRRIAVRPDWIDQSDVLGLVNPISNRFEPGWLAIIARQCERNLDQLHVVLLDEMNLAPVEQYLAEYLSALEEARSGSDSTRLPLYSEGAEPVNRDEWPSSLPFPRNLIVIGTVNVDETTRVLSERVLDRANVLQLSIAMSSAHHGATSTPVRPWHVPFSEWDAICINRPDPSHHDFLVVVGDVLHSIGIGVGARAHVELERFLANAVGVVPADIALDLGVLQRIIPKIRGFKRDLTNGLDELLEKLEKQSCHRSARVVARWLEPSVSDDEFLDGTDARIGLLR